jgi:threonylcarbamoyladenosine tRNA methylthiotransferase MtaB
MKYSIITFGCRVNQADSMAIERDLRTRGGRPASGDDDADLVIVNSCSVTASADQGTRQAVRRIARRNARARLVLTGCYASRCPDEVAALPGVSSVIGNDRKDALVDHLFPAADSESGDVLTTADRYAGAEGPCGAPPPFLLGRTMLTVRVQTGCEEQCAYCVIPTTRGRSRSKPIDEVVAELQRAEAAGYREVTLTGVHLGAYGRDLDPASTLATLLREVVRHTRSLVLRLGSLEPMDAPAELVELAADGRIAPAFHLPLQHASDRMLARMRRPYTRDAYRRIVDRVREHLPHAAIRSDVIVGFPGETDRDFAELCAYLEGAPLTGLHVFPYSDRPGTEAAYLPERVAPAVVRSRGARVREIGGGLAARFRDAQTGSIRPALTIENGSVAVTDNGIRVSVSPATERNRAVRVCLGRTAARIVDDDRRPGVQG